MGSGREKAQKEQKGKGIVKKRESGNRGVESEDRKEDNSSESNRLKPIWWITAVFRFWLLGFIGGLNFVVAALLAAVFRAIISFAQTILQKAPNVTKKDRFGSRVGLMFRPTLTFLTMPGLADSLAGSDGACAPPGCSIG